MKKYLLLIFIIIVILVLYSVYIEPFNYKINEQTITVDASVKYNGLKIVHFTDTLINDKSNFEMLNNIANDINKIDPNIIIFTGNLIKEKINSKTKTNLDDFLSLIDTDAYKVAILDKNDNKTSEDLLIKHDYNIINDLSKYYFYKDINPILITNDTNLNLPEEKLDYNLVFMLLQNSDDFKKLSNSDIPIIAFSGNIGGEIKIPFYKRLFTNDGNKKYPENYYQDGNNQMYVSYGIGTSKRKARFLNKPSFNIYRIKTN